MKRSMPFKVEIPLPCEQSWENMKPMDDGRYCDHCSRKIVDFTKLADHEVVRLFLDSSGPVCGRFTESQLNRDLLALEKERANALVPVLLVSTALAAGIASNAVANQRPMDDIRQTEQRDTSGAPGVSRCNNSDATGLSVAKNPVPSPDTANRFNAAEVAIVTSFNIKREVAFTGYTTTTLPKTKRERRRTEQRYQKKFTEAARSKPLQVTTQPPADDVKQ